jgi:hypothetical protein
MFILITNISKMMKNTFEILNYDFCDEELTIDFAINNEEGYRTFKISEYDFYDFLSDNEYLEMFSDQWNYTYESHYTEHWVVSVDEYMSHYFSSDDLIDFIIYYFKNEDYPELQTETYES